MNYIQDKPAASILASKPSVAFSATSTAASATSAATSRSGGSKLLFGEIDTSSDRSSDSFASVCSFVLCDSSTFLRFWLEDECRDCFLSHISKKDLANLRLTCRDFSVRAAPTLFSDLHITFRTRTFTKPAQRAALDRLGYHVRTLTFNFPHSRAMLLPPLVDPNTGEELSFTYIPQIETPTTQNPKYGDLGTTDILTRQWPALFHAATNVPAFVHAFSSFVNLSHLSISCPGYDSSQRCRRSIVDFALISLRIAVERNNLNALESLTLSPVHASGILHLLPLAGYGASPRAARCWSRIKHLTLHVDAAPVAREEDEPDHFKILQIYLRNFQSNLTTLRFRWTGSSKGLIPIHRARLYSSPRADRPSAATAGATNLQQPCASQRKRYISGVYFPKLLRAEFENVQATAEDIRHFAETHRRTIQALNLDNVHLTGGTWDDALAPLTTMDRVRSRQETAEIPIMLSPTTANNTYPKPMERVEVVVHQADTNGRKSLTISKWLPSPNSSGSPKVKQICAARKLKEGFLDVIRKRSMFAWK